VKEILQALWAGFVLLVFFAIMVLKCESDRTKEQRTRDWLSGPKTPPAAEPKPDSSDPFGLNGGYKPVPRFSPRARTELERQRQFLTEWEKSQLDRMRFATPAPVIPVAPMPRAKPSPE
jgi:hypothetical protein